MLIKLRKLNYQANYTYAPPDETVICESNLIVSVQPVETRRTEKCVEIRFIDGVHWTCIGTVKEIFEIMKAKE